MTTRQVRAKRTVHAPRIVALCVLSSATVLASSDRFPATGLGASDIEITPVLHSSVQIEYRGRVLHIDPWSAADLSKLKPADLILVTDDPIHHLDVKAIEKLRKPGAPAFIPAGGKSQVPDGIVLMNGQTTTAAGVAIEAVAAYDIKPGAPEHPKGKSNGYVVTIGGRRIYFSGVTECVPEVQALKNIDIAFLPMNIPVERMTPAAAASCTKAISPKVVYIYHYDQDWAAKASNPNARAQGVPGGISVAQSLDAFAEAVKGTAVEFRRAKWYPDEPDPVRHDIDALSAGCPAADEIKAIDHDLKLFFDHDPTRGTRACSAAEGSRDLTVMQSRVYRALAAMRRLEFTEPLPWTKEPVYRWLTKSVRGVRFRSDAPASFCCQPDGIINVRAVVEPAPGGGQSGFALGITESTQMATDVRLLITFMQLLVHEARHNNGKPHTCGSKDNTIREMGAWGAAYTFQRWIAEKTELDRVPQFVRLNLAQQMDQICRLQLCSPDCAAQP